MGLFFWRLFQFWLSPKGHQEGPFGIAKAGCFTVLLPFLSLDQWYKHQRGISLEGDTNIFILFV